MYIKVFVVSFRGKKRLGHAQSVTFRVLIRNSISSIPTLFICESLPKRGCRQQFVLVCYRLMLNDLLLLCMRMHHSCTADLFTNLFRHFHFKAEFRYLRRDGTDKGGQKRH